MGILASKQENESSPVSTTLAREVQVQDEQPESGALYYYIPGHFRLVHRSSLENSRGPTTGHLSPSTLHRIRPGHQQTNILPWSTYRKLHPRDKKSPEFIDRKVKALLNKLTMERFDSISEQILEWANRSVNEVDGRTLIQVIRLIFERATDEEAWSDIYARLCRFLMERISQDVRDEEIMNADGKPIAGGNLFRKYLLNRCQEDFERGWSAREAAFLAAARKAKDDKVLAAAAKKVATGKEVLYSDEYYASQKAKHRGLGLVKFIGELFKLQMLTERIMHECIKKLLSNVENPEEEEIESLCTLLKTVGQALDTQKARNHMEIYFGRMQELANSRQISSRIQYMLVDIIELRTRKWVPRTQVAAPIIIAEVHQKAERDHLITERETVLGQAGDPGSREYGPPNFGDNSWRASSVRPPTKASDFVNFGNIYKSTRVQFGPPVPLSRKEQRSSAPTTLASSPSNTASALTAESVKNDSGPIGDSVSGLTEPIAVNGDIALEPASTADTAIQPKRSNVKKKKKKKEKYSDVGPVNDDEAHVGDHSERAVVSATTNSSAAGAALAGMSLGMAKKQIQEYVKELFMLRHLGRAEEYFSAIPPRFRWYIVEELVHLAVDANELDLDLISEVFAAVAAKSLIDENQFSRGFTTQMECLEDTSEYSPNAYNAVARLLRSSKLSQAAVERLTDKMETVVITPKEKLLKKYALFP